MNDLQSVLCHTSLKMKYKNIDFFDFLDQKEKKAQFYPKLILEMSEYSHYDREKALILAEVSQLLFYSLEIHEKISCPQYPKTEVILAGDYLYSQIFKIITTRNFEELIPFFTTFIKEFSAKRILFFDGEMESEELLRFKYVRPAEIAARVITKDNPEMLQVASDLSDLFYLHMTDAADVDMRRQLLLKEKKDTVSAAVFSVIRNTVPFTGDNDNE